MEASADTRRGPTHFSRVRQRDLPDKESHERRIYFTPQAPTCLSSFGYFSVQAQTPSDTFPGQRENRVPKNRVTDRPNPLQLVGSPEIQDPASQKEQKLETNPASRAFIPMSCVPLHSQSHVQGFMQCPTFLSSQNTRELTDVQALTPGNAT